MTILGLSAGRISARFGSRNALLAGPPFTLASFTMLTFAHSHPYDLLIAASLLGIGIGLAFAASATSSCRRSQITRRASPAA